MKIVESFQRSNIQLAFTMKDRQNLVQTDGIDLITFGQRLRHLRRTRGLTLNQLGERVGRAPSALSLIENGRREPKLSLIEQLATALSVPVSEVRQGEAVHWTADVTAGLSGVWAGVCRV